MKKESITVNSKVFYRVCFDSINRRISDPDADFVWCAAIVKKIYLKTVDIEFIHPLQPNKIHNASKVQLKRLRETVEDNYHNQVFDGYK